MSQPAPSTQSGSARSVLRKRLLTAGVLIALFVFLILQSPPAVICGVVVLIVLAASWEYSMLTAAGQNRWDRLLAMLLTSLVPIAFYTGRPTCMVGSLFLPVLLLSVRSLHGGDDLKARFEGLMGSFFGVLYIGLCMSHFILLRDLVSWKPWIFSILAVTYLGDGVAYLVGSSVGRTRLSPRLSPKKTVEGAAGGVLGSVIAMLLCKYLFSMQISVGETILFSLAIAVTGQLGDLVESLIKRSCGVKDSGSLLPGHGGILDRLDSLLLAAPVGYYLALVLQAT
ncbi:MAG: phosphatidate cytidylyltransferase [bacterium]